MRIERCLAILSLVVIVLLGRSSHADNIDVLRKQLKDSSEKVRFAAAVNLAKTEDPRAIDALIEALAGDADKNVRGAAAVGLGKLIAANPGHDKRSATVRALTRASAVDSNAFVKDQAKAALSTIANAGSDSKPPDKSGSSSSPGKGGIYVNVGPMSSKTTSSKNDKLRALMVKTTEKTLAKVAPAMATTWSGGAPTKQALASKGVSGFYVDGTLNTLDIKVSGGGATISCKVSMLLADFPDKSVFGFLNGGASVTASSSQSDQDLASEDCVMAVIENLIANKIIPTIKSKAP
jgi:hypothetical protein